MLNQNLHKRFFEIVGLDTADIMRSGAVEGVHQQLQGLTELRKQRQKRHGELKLDKLSNQSTKLSATRAHLEAHCEFVFSGGSFP